MPETNASRIIIGEQDRLVMKGEFEQMRDRVANLLEMSPMHSDQNRGFFSTRQWSYKGLTFARSYWDASIIHSRRVHADNYGSSVLIQRYISGDVRSHKDGFVMDRAPGSVFLIDLAHTTQAIHFPHVTDAIYISKDALGFNSAVHPPFVRFSDNPAMGRLIYFEMDQLFQSLLAENAVDDQGVHRLVACLKLAIGSEHQDSDVRARARQALAHQIRAYIEQNLGDWDLSVSSILDNFGVSRASLYRMFDDLGGVRQYISNRRLHRAVVELSEGPVLRGQICTLADKWGFSSHSNFNRSVKQVFGVSPGSLVQTTIPAASESDTLA